MIKQVVNKLLYLQLKLKVANNPFTVKLLYSRSVCHYLKVFFHRKHVFMRLNYTKSVQKHEYMQIDGRSALEERVGGRTITRTH